MEVTIQLDPSHRTLELFGLADKNLRMLRESLGVQITARKSDLIISGNEDDVNRTADIIDKMQKHLIRHGSISIGDVNNSRFDVIIRSQQQLTGYNPHLSLINASAAVCLPEMA